MLPRSTTEDEMVKGLPSSQGTAPSGAGVVYS